MEPREYVASLARDSELLADAADAAGPGADVPTCPGWKVEDLLQHCAAGDLWARTIVETGNRSSRDLPADAPTGAALVEYFRDGARALVQTLTDTDPNASVWTFSPSDRTARFWIRRRAQEAAIHRFDAQSAAGSTAPIDAALAADGIDEYLTVFVPRFGAGVAPDGETLHFHCTDVEGEWLVARRRRRRDRDPRARQGRRRRRGTASDLILYLWGRVPADRLDVFGDGAALEAFRQAVKV